MRKVNPNLIVFTGDLVDSDKFNEKDSLALMIELVKISPVYFVKEIMNGGLGNSPH